LKDGPFLSLQEVTAPRIIINPSPSPTNYFVRARPVKLVQY
jgi:hypothetical protein